MGNSVSRRGFFRKAVESVAGVAVVGSVVATKGEKIQSSEQIKQETKPILVKSKPKKLKVTSKAEVAIEVAIRRYVKRSGGFRRDVPEVDKERTIALLGLLGRKKIAWNHRIEVKLGYGDSPPYSSYSGV